MTTEQLFEQFKKNNTKSRDGKTKNAVFFRTYGDVTFEEAFKSYLSGIKRYIELNQKIDEFEDFLIKSGYPITQSKISESRYYSYQGVKYRFSNHIYPTGSMSNDFDVVDFSANPELIETINY